MKLDCFLKGRLSLPVIGAPMFLVSGPDLVIAQCKSGIIGSFPALNARPVSMLDEWLSYISQTLQTHDQRCPEAPSAPFAVNLIVHRSNTRLEEDLALCVKHKVPLIITSLGAREDVNAAIHSYGGVVFHDVIHTLFARKAIEKGADGLIAVSAGAGGHAGTWSPFALMEEIREWWDGPLALSGAIATGRSILAARAMGADFAYIGSAFIATKEAQAPQNYKDMVVACSASDILYTDVFTGVYGNYLKPSLKAAGIDLEKIDQLAPQALSAALTADENAKAWRDIWGAGQGIGAIKDIPSVSDFIVRLKREYNLEMDKLCTQPLK